MDATVPLPAADRSGVPDETSRPALSQPEEPMNNTNTGAALLPPLRVASLLSVSRTTVYRLIHVGALPVYRVSRSLRVARPDIERYLARVRGPESYARA